MHTTPSGGPTAAAPDDRLWNADYLKVLAAQYPEDAFALVGELNKETSFIGQMGYSIQYTASKDGKTVRGYVIMAAVKKYLYVFHFSASYGDYVKLQNVLRYIVQSAKPKETEGKK